MTEISAHHRRRLAAETRFRWYGRLALGIALAMLALLLITLFVRGIGGFTQVQLRLDVPITAELRAEAAARSAMADVPASRFILPVRQALATRFSGEAHMDKPTQKAQASMVSLAASALAARRAIANAPADAESVTIWVPASTALERSVKTGDSQLTDVQARYAAELETGGDLRTRFNTAFFTGGDSRQAENAGFLGAIIGSLFTMLVCVMVAFPLGVAAAVYLEEFAPKHWLSDVIEVNINNLAAVPSIIFGLLGLVVFISLFGLPRSAPLVGGLTLALMILPVIIIATRSAIRAVPDSIRQAALGLGATRLQVIGHHTLPLALPGIMTGTILGVARALGETAPLLMIGMVAFVADVPTGIYDAATAMPVQVFLWATSPEAGFVEKTAAGILVLLAVLLALNAAAIYVRRKFEIRW